jgi:hypothetical protein
MASEGCDDFVIYESEVEMGQRYEPIVVRERVPRFWPPRVWDSRVGLMSEEESGELKRRIDQLNIQLEEQATIPACKLKRSQSSSTGIRKPGKVGRPRKYGKEDSRSTLVTFRMDNFQTDEDDTDWCDF